MHLELQDLSQANSQNKPEAQTLPSLSVQPHARTRLFRATAQRRARHNHWVVPRLIFVRARIALVDAFVADWELRKSLDQ